MRGRRVRRNPPLLVYGNPPAGFPVEHFQTRGARFAVRVEGSISRRAVSIQYRHVKDGAYYEHEFGPGDAILAVELPGGKRGVLLVSAHDLWADFDDEGNPT